LTQTGPIFQGGGESGIGFDTQLAGVYRLNDRLQLGGFFNVAQSVNFTDLGGGLMLRYLFDSRPAVFSTDLPEQPWNP
jgi:hypothetical protein